jgi:hypothetical protein
MASITINFTAAPATRLAAALQETLGLDAPATLAELKDYIVTDLKQIVRTSEKRAAIAAAATGAADVNIT